MKKIALLFFAIAMCVGGLSGSAHWKWNDVAVAATATPSCNFLGITNHGGQINTGIACASPGVGPSGAPGSPGPSGAPGSPGPSGPPGSPGPQQNVLGPFEVVQPSPSPSASPNLLLFKPGVADADGAGCSSIALYCSLIAAFDGIETESHLGRQELDFDAALYVFRTVDGGQNKQKVFEAGAQHPNTSGTYFQFDTGTVAYPDMNGNDLVCLDSGSNFHSFGDFGNPCGTAIFNSGFREELDNSSGVSPATQQCISQSVTASGASTSITFRTSFANGVEDVSAVDNTAGTKVADAALSAISTTGFTFVSNSGDVYYWRACGQ